MSKVRLCLAVILMATWGAALQAGCGGGGVMQTQACHDYLACVAKATPEALPALMDADGAQGTCWVSESAAALCDVACKAGLQEAVSTLIAKDIAVGVTYPSECFVGVVPSCVKWLKTTYSPSDAQSFGPYTKCWTTTAKAASTCKSQCTANLSCTRGGNECFNDSDCCSGSCDCGYYLCDGSTSGSCY